MSYVSIQDLPQNVFSALRSLTYYGKDIEVVPSEQVHMGPGGTVGRRKFVCVMNLETGERKTYNGSFGGANPFVNTVPDSDQTFDIPVNGIAITGSIGTGPTWAKIHVHPSNIASLLPEVESISDREQKILYVFKGYKSSYRKQALSKHNVSQEELDKLVNEGYLKRAKNGATSITTKGKNQAKRDLYW